MRAALMFSAMFIGVFVGSLILTGNDAHPSSDVLLTLGARTPGAAAYWRWFIAIFLHGHLIHLLACIITLCAAAYIAGSYLSGRAFGLWFLVIGFLAHGAGAIVTSDIAVGSSGGAIGMSVCGLTMWIFLRGTKEAFSARDGVALALGTLLIATLAFPDLNPRMDIISHAAGALSGLLLGVCLSSKKQLALDGPSADGLKRV
jgi:rhomboid protease GluP